MSGTALDGDSDGTVGGVYNFWFRTQSLDRIVEVTGNGNTIVEGQTVTITSANGTTRAFEFDSDASVVGSNVPIPFVSGATPSPSVDIAASLVASIVGPQGFNDVNAARVTGVNGDLVALSGERNVVLSLSSLGLDIHGKTIFVDKSPVAVNSDGSLDRPFSNISNPAFVNAFANTHPDDIVRIVGNGGNDNDLTTHADTFRVRNRFWRTWKHGTSRRRVDERAARCHCYDRRWRGLQITKRGNWNR